MSYHLPDHPKAKFCFGVVLYGKPDISYPVARNGLFYPQIKGFSGDGKQFHHFLTYLSYRKCEGRISEISVFLNPTINRNDISFLHNRSIRNAMDDNLIER